MNVIQKYNQAAIITCLHLLLIFGPYVFGVVGLVCICSLFSNCLSICMVLFFQSVFLCLALSLSACPSASLYEPMYLSFCSRLPILCLTCLYLCFLWQSCGVCISFSYLCLCCFYVELQRHLSPTSLITAHPYSCAS